MHVLWRYASRPSASPPAAGQPSQPGRTSPDS
ncbi:hypothetical protein NLX86_11410 [Streptomyces sp. A3M-1-3]|nr:hypothetical protein [Streptomyces sp. A3M-1-3]MCP3818701.1 hypothetical protein [Streptomyces sp. A3M-1-3]